MKNIGDHIDKYRIIHAKSSSLLSEQYVVELASDPGKYYILQKWPTVSIATSQRYLLFLKQMNRLKELHSPFFLEVEDFGADTDNHPYVLLAYEAEQLRTLSERLQHGTLPEDEAENILGEVSAALVLTHQHDLVYGLLSPENIFLTPAGETRLLPFCSSALETNTARAAFPPAYRFPESEASRLSDQYVLAGLVQQLLLEQGLLPEDALVLQQAIARAQSREPRHRFESLRAFLGEVGIPLHLAENEKEFDAPPRSEQGTAGTTGTEPSATASGESVKVTNGWRLSRRSNEGQFLRAFGFAILPTLLFYLALFHYQGSLHYSATNGQTLTMVGSPGETISIAFPWGSSIQGDWGSAQGLTLQLQGESKPMVIVPPTPDSWGDTLFVLFQGNSSIEMSENFHNLQGSLTLPPSLSSFEGHTWNGSITGEIFFPVEEGAGFANTSMQVNIPVSLELVAPENLPWQNGEILLILATLIALLLLISFPVLPTLLQEREKWRIHRSHLERGFAQEKQKIALSIGGLVTECFLTLPVIGWLPGGVQVPPLFWLFWSVGLMVLFVMGFVYVLRRLTRRRT